MMTEPKGWAKCPEMGVIVAGMKFHIIFYFFSGHSDLESNSNFIRTP